MRIFLFVKLQKGVATMDFEKAIKDFTSNRIEEVMLSTHNKAREDIFTAFQAQVIKLGIDQDTIEILERELFVLIDSQNQLIYRQGLADALDFLASLADTRYRLGI